ncbi:cysteine dioxygenase [Variovorax paradoxus]|nr:cysteine dioxygenase [Variovorax paradoxus]
MSEKLEQFVREVEAALAGPSDEARILEHVRRAMGELVAADDWLAPEMAVPHPQFYQQYLLHRDSQARFSVVSFVWGPGQQTPVHDHTVWGVIGMLRGSEVAQSYLRTDQGMQAEGPPQHLHAGQVALVSPTVGDIHRVSNAHHDRVSISIHVYGADIGNRRRHVFDLATGAAKEFVSGYANVRGAVL